MLSYEEKLQEIEKRKALINSENYNRSLKNVTQNLSVDNHESLDLSEYLETETCDKHGEYQATYLLNAGDRLFSSVPCCPKCHAERLAQSIIGQSGIQKRFLECRFDNYQTTTESQIKVKGIVIRYASNFHEVLMNGSSLILSGSVGTGKTHLACAVANHIAARGKTSIFRTFSEITGMIRDGWSRAHGKTAQQVINDLMRFDLRIFDEFGAQNLTDTELNIIFDLVNRCYAEQKPLIILTNLSKADFKAKIGDRVYDRLTHGGVFLSLNWESYRQVGK